MTVVDVRSLVLPPWRPEPVAAAGAACSSLAQSVAVALHDLNQSALGTADWSGPAATAAAGDRQVLVARTEQLAAVLSRLALALEAAADQVVAAVLLADRAEATARAHGLLVTDAGLVVDLVGAAPFTSAPAVAEVTALAARGRQLADDADQDLARALRSTGQESALTGAAAAPVGFVAAIREPESVPAWWQALSRQDQVDDVERRPEVVGATDGLPAWARDRANRILLDRAESTLTEQVAALSPPHQSVADILGGAAGSLTVGTFGGGARRVAYQQSVDKLAAVRATRQVLDQRDGQTRQLVAFDVSGRQATVAVSVGDVDRADRLAVIVDGFTTTVQHDLPGADAMAADLVDLARRESMGWGDRGEVAVVTWLGYDTPLAADTLHSSHSVVLRASAEAGATSLAAFLRGLDPDRPLTLVGHSYGSTVAGLAVARGGTGVDDLVVMGSPGLGVSDLGRLGLGAGRVHVLEARDDPVADLGWFGADPSRLPGVDRLSTEPTRLPDGRTGGASLGHSAYLTPGTTSQWNVAAVVAGVPPQRQ